MLRLSREINRFGGCNGDHLLSEAYRKPRYQIANSSMRQDSEAFRHKGDAQKEG